MPAYLSPERRELFHATIPLLDSQLGFFRQRERLLPVNPAHLKACVRTASAWSAATSTGRISTPTAA